MAGQSAKFAPRRALLFIPLPPLTNSAAPGPLIFPHPSLMVLTHHGARSHALGRASSLLAVGLWRVAGAEGGSRLQGEGVAAAGASQWQWVSEARQSASIKP